MFTTSHDGRLLIRGIEKFEPSFYYDSKGISTVGFGHVIVANGKQVDRDTLGQAKADELSRAYMMKKWGKLTLTEAEGDKLFSEDMRRFEDAVNSICDDKTYQAEYDAMVSFAFNCGEAGFLKSSVARFHKQNARKVGDVKMSELATWSKLKKPATNIQQAFVAWSFTDGKWALGLFRRRVAELLVYSGRSAEEATKIAWSFKG